MEIAFGIIWLLIGFVAVWRAYFGIKQYFYDTFEKVMPFYEQDYGITPCGLMLIMSPVFVLGGGLSLLLFEKTLIEGKWSFKK